MNHWKSFRKTGLPKTLQKLRPPKPSIRPLLFLSLVGFIIVQIVAFSPSLLEQADQSVPLESDNLLHEVRSEKLTAKKLAPSIPDNKIPDYSINDFRYVSTQDGRKQWKIFARTAYLYNKENLVHALEIEAHLYNPDGEVTIITGKEAQYFMTDRDLEVFGDVHSQFSDGLEMYSQYMKYQPGKQKVTVPKSHPVRGGGKVDDQNELHFSSLGMLFEMGDSKIFLPRRARVTLKKVATSPNAKGGDTRIESDTCELHRNTNIAYFEMYPQRTLKRRFVHILQPDLFTRSRRAELHYGDFSEIIHYLTAYDDVFIRDKAATDEVRYATAGVANFDAENNLVVLTHFPQVYQGSDTIAGDKIIMHRETDVVEVDHSNAFSMGETQNLDSTEPSKKQKQKPVRPKDRSSGS